MVIEMSNIYYLITGTLMVAWYIYEAKSSAHRTYLFLTTATQGKYH